MKCKNCGSLIPDQSVFCPYCGVSSAEMNYRPVPQPQSAVSYSAPIMPQSPIPASKKKKAKERKCPKCGNLLSKKQKACPACGEAIPADPKKAKTAIISMSVAICLLLCSTVYFMLEMFQGNRAIDELRAETTYYAEEIEKLEQQVVALNLEIEMWRKDIDMWREKYKDISSKYSDLVLEFYGTNL